MNDRARRPVLPRATGPGIPRAPPRLRKAKVLVIPARAQRALSRRPRAAFVTPPASADAPPRGVVAERRWVIDRLLPFCLLGLALPIAAFTAWGTLDWLRPGGRPFPGFFVMQNGIVPTVGLFRWTGMTHQMPFAARVVAVDGRPVRSNREVYAYVESLPVGTDVTYTIEKDGRTETRHVPTMRFAPVDYALTLGLFVLNGFMGLLGGFVVALLRPRNPAARAFLLYGFFWGLFPLTGTTLYDPELAWLSPLYWVAQTVFPATFIHLGLVFPVERDVVRRRPVVLVVPYLISLALLGWIFHSYFADPPSWLPLQATFLYSGISMPIFLGLLAYSYWENRTPMVRPRLQTIIPGFAIAAASAIYGFLNSGLNGNFPMNLIAVTPIVFFGSIAYAITAHDAFDINRVLRQTALYFALTLVVTVAYAAIIAAIGFFLPGHNVVASVGLQIPVFVVFGLLFQPVRSWLQRLIDATFFRRGVDYRRAVSEVSAALTSVLDLGEILDRVATTLTASFSLESFAAVIRAGDRATVWRYAASTRRTTEHLAAHDFPILRERLAVSPVRALTLVDYESGEPTDTALAEELGAPLPALAVPLVLGGVTLGALLLGRKRSGLPFGRDDRDLIDTLAAQSAIAVQNALSFRSLAELNVSLEDRVQDRTQALERSHDELARKHVEVERSRAELSQAYQELQSAQRQLLQSEKLASLGELVAGVAHEINNPVSFIVGNLEPLQQQLDELRARAQQHHDPELEDLVRHVRRIVDTMGRGAERTAGIVQDLRTFSRVGDAARGPMDVQESLEVNLRLLKPKWHRRIQIERVYGDVPAIHAVPGQINQVFMNLLANACDATPADGTIRITTESDGDLVRVTIADTGHGIPDDRIGRIFDPFFTTKPHGQGTGLGLSISHGIVADHGGRITVTSRPGKGAAFTVELPVQAR